MIAQQSDSCPHCGNQKVLLVTDVTGATNAISPGASFYMPKRVCEKLELTCTGCGLLYSLASLVSPIEIYE